MLNTSLRGVVSALFLRPVDNASTHRSKENNISLRLSTYMPTLLGVLEIIDHNLARGLGTKEAPSQIDVDQMAESVGIIGFCRHVGTTEHEDLVKRISFLRVATETYSAIPAEQIKTSRPPSFS